MNARAEAVVVLHGLWMNRWAMSYLVYALRRAGYDAHAIGYASVRGRVDDHLAAIERAVAALDAPRAHLVGHSMGGVLVLRYLQRSAAAGVARAVLLGAPVAGCRAAIRLARKRWGRKLLGESVSLWLEPPDTALDARCEVGAIAGTLSFGLGRIVSGSEGIGDGVVLLEETRLAALRDHIALPVSHSGMLVSPRVARQTVAFLQGGKFLR